MKKYINNLKHKIKIEMGLTPKTEAKTLDGKFYFYDCQVTEILLYNIYFGAFVIFRHYFYFFRK